MVSNDVTKLTPGRGMSATFADIQGKILADTKIYCTEDSFIAELLEPLKDKIQTHLQKYLIADDVEIDDLTDGYGIVSLQGPKSTLLLEALLGTKTLPDHELNHGEFPIDTHRYRLVRATHT
jgi:aminomethyltransferase